MSTDRDPRTPGRSPAPERRGRATLFLIVAGLLIVGGVVGMVAGNPAQSGIAAPAVVFLLLARRSARREAPAQHDGGGGADGGPGGLARG